MSEWVYFGVDPGKSGAVVCLDNRGRLSALLRMPTIGKGRRSRVDAMRLSRWMEKVARETLMVAILDGLVTVGIERVASMPGQGVASMFSFGHATGTIYGIVEANGWAIVEATPRVWQGAMLSGNPKGKAEIKAASVKEARQRWPQLLDTLHVKANWGVADAALIAEFTRRQFQQAGVKQA